jgi:hypothetical protein
LRSSLRVNTLNYEPPTINSIRTHTTHDIKMDIKCRCEHNLFIRSELDFLPVYIQEKIAEYTSVELESLHHMAVHGCAVMSLQVEAFVWRPISRLHLDKSKEARLIAALACLKRMSLLREKEEREAKHDEKMKQAEAEIEEKLKTISLRELELEKREKAVGRQA